jgi:hypothetical protein
VLAVAALLSVVVLLLPPVAAPRIEVVPNRVTLSILIGLLLPSFKASGRVWRDGDPAANVTVTIRAGKTRKSLMVAGTVRTRSDGRYSKEEELPFLLEVCRSAAASSVSLNFLYFRATTSFAKSRIIAREVDSAMCATGRGSALARR